MRLTSILGVLAAVLLACGGGGGGDNGGGGVETNPYFINVGGAAVGEYSADNLDWVTGGSTYDNTDTMDLSLITTNVPPAEIFNSERYGEFTYTIPGLTAGGAYTVTLYFEESFLSDVGLRLFSVTINGDEVLTDYDIYAAAGGVDIAIDESFDVTADEAGQIAIGFIPNVENPKVCGIRVEPAPEM